MILLFLDTASVYRNEKSIGNHLKTLMKESEISKDEIFITSKLCELIILISRDIADTT